MGVLPKHDMKFKCQQVNKFDFIKSTGNWQHKGKKIIKKKTIHLKGNWTDKTRQIPEETNDLTIHEIPNLTGDWGNTNWDNDIIPFTKKMAK